MPAVRRSKDVNLEVGSLLLDLAQLQPTEFSRQGYKRAGKTILQLPEQLPAILRRHELRRIPNIGPSSERIALEYLETGASAKVNTALEQSPRQREILAARALRGNFLSYAAVRTILGRKSSGIVTSEDYRGDLQMHSTWSDGSDSLDGMIQAALARGHTRAAITDHSYGLPIAHGVSMEDLARQHAEIDTLNQTYSGRFRLWKGIEANIKADGTVDMTREERSLVEIVVASPHSLLRKAFDQTARMRRAVTEPGVHILGHPRGRMFTRQGVLAEWPEVFAAAALHEVAVEIDGDYWRQDLDHVLARQALAAGCLFALDSDAHSGPELYYSDYALAHARLAGIPAERIVNCWEDGRFDAWAQRRRAA